MTRLRLPLLVSGLTLVLIGPLMAQHATRGPEVERLGFLVGDFEGELRSTAPGSPPQTGRMTFHGEWDLDGWIVQSNYEQKLGNAAPVKGHLIFRWRPRDSTYAFEGYANTPMEPHHLTGRWDASLIYEGTMGGIRFREIWKPQGPDTLVTRMEFQEGERWTAVSEAVLVRRP
jgi:hypothetical protein